MPHVQCNIQAGLGDEKKRMLALEIAKALNETLGSPMEYIHVSVVEVPANEFVESGQIGLDYGAPALPSS